MLFRSRQQIANIESIDNGAQWACGGTLVLVWKRGECEDQKHGEDGHLAGEDERGESGVDVVVGHVFCGLEDAVA